MSEPSTAPAAATDGPVTGLVNIKRVDTVALWRFALDLDNCPICRKGITELCVDCQADVVVDDGGAFGGKEGNECRISFGVCNHAYHTHCIGRWMKNGNSKCCMCDRDFETTTIKSIAELSK